MKLTKVAVMAALAATVTGAAFATPQTQFKQGQFQIDAGAYFPKADADSINTKGTTDGGDAWTDSFDSSNKSKANFTGGLTYGITDRLGLQYQYTGLKTKAQTHPDADGNWKNKTDGQMNEANLVYSLNKNFAVYGGWAGIKNKYSVVGTEGHSDSYNKTNNIAQAGLIAKAPIGHVFEVFGKAGIGTKKTTTWEAGLGAKITPDLDLAGGYRYINTKLFDKGDKVGGVTITDDQNISYKGWFTTLSYRFGGHSEAAPAPVAVEQPAYVPAPAPAVAQEKKDYYVDSIHFATNSYVPLPSQTPNLDLMVNTAKEYPNDTMILVGNTDNVGSPAYNETLSKERVENVYNYAINHGIPASQLQATYRGENDPAETNATAAGRAANRRVDVWVNR